MGWGFRRSISIGGVRLTISPRGLTTSVGGKGFRLTSGPRGVYVTAGAGGFYYRQRLGGGGRSSHHSARPAATRVETSSVYESTVVQSAEISALTDISQDDFVSSLNEWTSRGALQVLAVLVAVAGLVVAAAMKATENVLGEVAAYGGILFLLARCIEHRRRRFLLMFDLGPAATERYQRMQTAFAELAASGSLRGVKLIDKHSDWKRSGGATRSLSFETATLRRGTPQYIVSNIQPWILSTQGMELCLFPDRVLIRSKGSFAALSYEALDVALQQSDFIWDDALPSDAVVIGRTWLYVRKDGGADARFNNNRQIPVVRTASLLFSSATGLRIMLQTTRLAAADSVQERSQSYAGEAHQLSMKCVTGVSADVARALATLGLAHVPSGTELRGVYLELVSRSEPKNASVALDGFHDERMAELKDAYLLLQNDPALRAPSGTLIEHPPTHAPRKGDGRSLEIAVVAAAFLLAGGVFAFARANEPPVRPASARQAETAATAVPVESAKPARVYRRVPTGCLLRREASMKSKQLAVVAKGNEVAVLEERGAWIRVQDATGREGWTSPQCWNPTIVKKPRTRPQQRPVASVASAGSDSTASVGNDPMEGAATGTGSATADPAGMGEVVDPFKE